MSSIRRVADEPKTFFVFIVSESLWNYGPSGLKSIMTFGLALVFYLAKADYKNEN